MLKIPLNNIIDKIKQEKGLSEEEINQKIEAKLKQLSGLISREGAAHIIANELGVKIFEQVSGKLQIKNILSGMRNVETIGKITNKFELREFKTENREGKVANMIIGDETGKIRIVMWGDQAENINKLKEGDIIKIVGGYVRENQGRPEVHMNDRTKLIINPEGETVGEVKSGPTAERKPIKDLTEGMENVELLGTIVQAFEPRFYTVCPECRKKVTQEGEQFVCQQHNVVTPNFAYVLNLFLDDGTENIRCVFFKNQTDRLLNKTQEEILKYKDNPQDFEPMKTELLGNIVKLVGRVTKNQMFDRLEFVTQLVFLNPDPEQEINKLEKTDAQTNESESASAPEAPKVENIQ
jgi:replication factor A1